MTKHPLISYFTKLAIFSIIITFIAMIANLIYLKITGDIISKYLPYYTLMYFICTGIGYSIVYNSVSNKKMKFETIFMITKFAKIFVYILILSIIMIKKIDNSIAFAMSYLILYTFYLIFDTITFKNFSRKI